jgi:hypothetical protein
MTGINQDLILITYIGVGTSTIHFGIDPKSKRVFGCSIAMNFVPPTSDKPAHLDLRVYPNATQNKLEAETLQDLEVIRDHSVALVDFVREANSIVGAFTTREEAFAALRDHFTPDAEE